MDGNIMSNINDRIFHIIEGGWRRRYVILIPVLVMPFLGLIVGTMSPKHYSSHTSMLIQETAKMNPFLEDLAVSAMLKERLDALRTLLHSRHILGLVAMERGLIDEESSPEKHDEVIEKLSSSLSIKMAGKDLIRIDYNSNDPDDMKENLEVISKYFVDELLAPERSSMNDSSDFLSQHLEHRQRELDKSEAALAEFRNRHSTELPEMHLTNVARLAKLKQRLAEREAEFSGASRKLGGIDQQLSKTNPVLGRIEEKIVKIQGELALLRARYTDKHSNIQGALRNLRRLQKERQVIMSKTGQTTDIDQLWAIANSAPITSDKSAQPLLVSQLENLQLARSEVDGLQEEISSLKKMIHELEEQTSRYGENETEFSKLERDIQVKRDLYDNLLIRYEKAQITHSLGVFEKDKRIKIIDRPFLPTAPDNIQLYLFFIAGVIGGLLLGSGVATILELSDTTLRRRNQLEAITGVSVLSRIPPISYNVREPVWAS